MKKTLCTAVIATVSSIACPAVEMLDDHGLSAVYAQGPGLESLPLLSTLSLLLDPRRATISIEDAAAFNADIVALRGTPFGASLYDGREVSKLVFADQPTFDVQTDLSRLLGLPAGPSLGSVAFNQVNISGTTLWIWGH